MMKRLFAYHSLALAFVGALAACAEATTPQATQAEQPLYLGAQSQLMGPDLVNISARLRNTASEQAVKVYADCVAAKYAIENGYGFARHIRTNLGFEGGVWHADAVYSISSALPRGLRTIDAEVVAQNCAADKIPTV